ncbi:CPBP family intramembrane glutamic endopeptidase [Anaerosphaera aminiphila]
MLFTNLILDIILYSSIINKLDLSNFPSINYFFPSLFATLNTYICAPIFEELIFRVIFFNYFFNKNDKLYNILAIVVSSIIFGLMHGRNIIFLLV